jgi:hypothetical protein
MEELGISQESDISSEQELPEPASTQVFLQVFRQEIKTLQGAEHGIKTREKAIKDQELIQRLQLAQSILGDNMVLIKHIAYNITEAKGLSDQEISKLIEVMPVGVMAGLITDIYVNYDDKSRGNVDYRSLKHKDGNDAYYQTEYFEKTAVWLASMLAAADQKGPAYLDDKSVNYTFEELAILAKPIEVNLVTEAERLRLAPKLGRPKIKK